MARIASCSLKGLPSARCNARRRQLLHEIAQALERHAPVDAVVLSGGYFVEQDKPNAYLDLSFEERCGLLLKSEFGDDATAAARALDDRRKGALLMFGVDTDGPKSPMGDQLCVAWSANGPVGVGRKVFPTKDEGRDGYVVNAEDYGAKERVVRVGGAQVLLCACYDGYGIANQPDRSGYVRCVSVAGSRLSRRDARFKACVSSAVSGWSQLVEAVDATAVAIHRFKKTNGDGFSTNYWRRHGIATASAKLNGGWVVAGANFEGRPPHVGVDVLAAQGVSPDYLEQGNGRKTQDAVSRADYVVGGDEVRIRLFDFDDA